MSVARRVFGRWLAEPDRCDACRPGECGRMREEQSRGPVAAWRLSRSDQRGQCPKLRWPSGRPPPVASPANGAPASLKGMNVARLASMTENAQLVVTLSCPDRPGIVHAVTGVIGEAGGNVIQSQQFGDPDTGTFFMRVEVDSPKGREPIDEGLANVAD